MLYITALLSQCHSFSLSPTQCTQVFHDKFVHVIPSSAVLCSHGIDSIFCRGLQDCSSQPSSVGYKRSGQHDRDSDQQHGPRAAGPRQTTGRPESDLSGRAAARATRDFRHASRRVLLFQPRRSRLSRACQNHSALAAPHERHVR